MTDKYTVMKESLYMAEFNYLYNAYVAYLRDTGVAERVAKSKLTAATQDFMQVCLNSYAYALVSLESPELGTEGINATLLHNTVTTIQRECIADFCDIAIVTIDDYPVNRVTRKKYFAELHKVLDERVRDILVHQYKLRKQTCEVLL